MLASCVSRCCCLGEWGGGQPGSLPVRRRTRGSSPSAALMRQQRQIGTSPAAVSDSLRLEVSCDSFSQELSPVSMIARFPEEMLSSGRRIHRSGTYPHEFLKLFSFFLTLFPPSGALSVSQGQKGWISSPLKIKSSLVIKLILLLII